jgi:hypothetical protein
MRWGLRRVADLTAGEQAALRKLVTGNVQNERTAAHLYRI